VTAQLNPDRPRTERKHAQTRRRRSISQALSGRTVKLDLVLRQHNFMACLNPIKRLTETTCEQITHAPRVCLLRVFPHQGHAPVPKLFLLEKRVEDSRRQNRRSDVHRPVMSLIEVFSTSLLPEF
jgi:hypothetical protein